MLKIPPRTLPAHKFPFLSSYNKTIELTGKEKVVHAQQAGKLQSFRQVFGYFIYQRIKKPKSPKAAQAQSLCRLYFSNLPDYLFTFIMSSPGLTLPEATTSTLAKSSVLVTTVITTAGWPAALILLQLPNRKRGLNHVAFTVRDIHEVIGGGIAMNKNAWSTFIGPGRHPVSSAYFWYVNSPTGGAFEYYTNDDYLTENWQPRELEHSLVSFTEWAVEGGIDHDTRRQQKKPEAV